MFLFRGKDNVETCGCLSMEVSKVVSVFDKHLQHPPLNGIILGQYKSDNINRMIQLTDVFCVLFGFDWTSNISLQYTTDSPFRDLIKQESTVYFCNHLYVRLDQGCFTHSTFLQFVTNKWQLKCKECFPKKWKTWI